jgi:uncharacterized DUF497 family protein
MPLKFDWNPKKAKQNIKKHGVSFDEAAIVFSDSLSMTYDDPDHSCGENRYIIIGFSALGNLLFAVCFSCRDRRCNKNYKGNIAGQGRDGGKTMPTSLQSNISTRMLKACRIRL